MNWLAHLALSPVDAPALRVGNVCGDFFTLAQRAELPPALRLGVQWHLAIDAFTDDHPVVARARSRFPASHRRVAGLLVDVLFDHLLARDWAHWMGGDLPSFTRAFYREALKTSALPVPVRDNLTTMAAQDWLTGYATWLGVEFTLQRLARRMSPRLARRCPMEPVPDLLAALLPRLEEDFAAFWPDLCGHCALLPLPVTAPARCGRTPASTV
jgi:acyl carrier protein phosphodiesterase